MLSSDTSPPPPPHARRRPENRAPRAALLLGLAAAALTLAPARPAHAGLIDWFVSLFREDVKQAVAPNVNTTANDHTLLGAAYAKVLTDVNHGTLRSLHQVLRDAVTTVSMEDRRRICAETDGLMVTTVRVSECSEGTQRVEPEGLPTQWQACASGRGSTYFPACVYVDARGRYHWDDGPSSPPEAELALPQTGTGAYKSLFWVAGQVHDYCYHHGNVTYGFSKQQCDDEFLSIMLKICANDFSRTYAWFQKSACEASAHVFHQAVVQFGQSAYEAMNTLVDYKRSMPTPTTDPIETQDARRLRDFDGDRRADLLCHDRITGAKWLDLAELPWKYTSTDWSTPGDFCHHVGNDGRLLKGDFNGDGRADLLCHDVRRGQQWVGFAQAGGRFDGTFWTRDSNWCARPSRLLVGDFDGDLRDDLLCHHTRSGQKWISYAKAGGELFVGTDWHQPEGWCGWATAELHVGDFNGDGRSDLLCHDRSLGYKWIDYADSAGRFNGTDWSTDLNWCSHPSHELHVGDFDGDGRDDLLCHDVAGGYKWVDYTDIAATFDGTDQEWSNGFCGHIDGELWVGDVNADGADDLICHDIRYGTKQVDLAWSLGVVDWTSTGSAGFCAHAAGELH